MDRRPTDAIALLTADHQQILYLLRAYQDASTPHRKRTIAAQILPALELHAQREETVFYPAFAQRADAAGTQLVAASLRAHQAVKEVMQVLRDLDAEESEAFAAKFQELRDRVEESVEGEETQLFPAAEAVLEGHLEDLQDEMHELKQQRTARNRRAP